MNPAIISWAIRHHVSLDALAELRVMFGFGEPAGPAFPGNSESSVQSRVRLEAAQKGVRLWRNNVGALKDVTGRVVRYGLANDTAAVNRVIKSGDLIGIRPVLVTQQMVGATIGQFVSREIKAANWHYTGTDRELAQLRWAELVVSMGGDAAFASGEGSL